MAPTMVASQLSVVLWLLSWPELSMDLVPARERMHDNLNLLHPWLHRRFSIGIAHPRRLARPPDPIRAHDPEVDLHVGPGRIENRM